MYKVTVSSEQAMLTLGSHLAKVCPETAVIFLHGQLGAGKTTFSRGFLRGLGYEGHVKSPTYTLVESYELGKRTVHHFDFYRVREPQELEYMGIQDYFLPHTICLIEWPDYGKSMLPAADLSCQIEIKAEEREVIFTAFSEQGKHILQRLKQDEK